MKTLVRLLVGLAHDLPDNLRLRMRIGVFKTARVVDCMWTVKCKPACNAKDVWPDGNTEVRTAKCEPRSANCKVRDTVESRAENREVQSTKCEP